MRCKKGHSLFIDCMANWFWTWLLWMCTLCFEWKRFSYFVSWNDYWIPLNGFEKFKSNFMMTLLYQWKNFLSTISLKNLPTELNKQKWFQSISFQLLFISAEVQLLRKLFNITSEAKTLLHAAGIHTSVIACYEERFPVVLFFACS